MAFLRRSSADETFIAHSPTALLYRCVHGLWCALSPPPSVHAEPRVSAASVGSVQGPNHLAVCVIVPESCAVGQQGATRTLRAADAPGTAVRVPNVLLLVAGACSAHRGADKAGMLHAYHTCSPGVAQVWQRSMLVLGAWRGEKPRAGDDLSPHTLLEVESVL